MAIFAKRDPRDLNRTTLCVPGFGNLRFGVQSDRTDWRRADELMITCQMFDHSARMRSFEIVAEMQKSLATEPPGPAEETVPQAPPAKEGMLQRLAGLFSPAQKH